MTTKISNTHRCPRNEVAPLIVGRAVDRRFAVIFSNTIRLRGVEEVVTVGGHIALGSVSANLQQHQTKSASGRRTTLGSSSIHTHSPGDNRGVNYSASSGGNRPTVMKSMVFVENG